MTRHCGAPYQCQLANVVLGNKQENIESRQESEVFAYLQDGLCLDWSPFDGQFDDLLASGSKIVHGFPSKQAFS